MNYRYEWGGNIYEITLSGSLPEKASEMAITINGKPFQVELLDLSQGEISLRREGKQYQLFWAMENGKVWISYQGCTYLLEKPSPRSSRKSTDHNQGDILRAPMPAQVRLVQVASGEAVEKGQSLMVLEAMKMEIRMLAPRSGIVARIHAEQGDQVERDAILVELAADDDAASAENR